MEFKEVIEQIIRNTVEKITSSIQGDLLKNELSFKKIVLKTQENVNSLGVSILETITKELDDRYLQVRPKEVTIRHNLKKRTMLTSLGEITLERRLYKNKESNKCFFAIDELLNIPRYSRVEQGLQARLLERATKGSFGEASRSINNKLSRQTIFNIVKKTKPIKYNFNEEKVDIPNIYIEADEDHIHLNNGKPGEVRLVYVHEGREEVCKTRTRLKNAKYFTSIKKGDEIWENVSSYIYHKYNVRKAKLHLFGDGAEWIKTGLQYLPTAEFKLDKFHVVKSVTSACANRKDYSYKIIKEIKNKDLFAVEQLYSDLRSVRLPVSTINNSLFYIDNNFDDISFLAEDKCSAEGHVSHVLSERMSSRPMGWSKNGAERIASLRAFMYNKGNFEDLIVGREKDLNVKEVKKRLLIKSFDKSIDAPKQAKVVGLDGKITGTSVLLRQLFKDKKIF